MVLVGAALVFVGILIVFDNASQYAPYEEEAIEVKDTIIVVPKEPAMLFGIVVDGLNIQNYVVKRNQRFSDLLDGYYVDGKAKRLLATISRNVFDFRKVATNKSTPSLPMTIR